MAIQSRKFDVHNAFARLKGNDRPKSRTNETIETLVQGECRFISRRSSTPTYHYPEIWCTFE